MELKDLALSEVELAERAKGRPERERKAQERTVQRAEKANGLLPTGLAAQIAAAEKANGLLPTGLAAQIAAAEKANGLRLEAANISAFEKMNKSLADAKKMAALPKYHRSDVESNVHKIVDSNQSYNSLATIGIKEKQQERNQAAEQLQLAKENTELLRKNTALLDDVTGVLKSSQEIEKQNNKVLLNRSIGDRWWIKIAVLLSFIAIIVTLPFLVADYLGDKEWQEQQLASNEKQLLVLEKINSSLQSQNKPELELLPKDAVDMKYLPYDRQEVFRLFAND